MKAKFIRSYRSKNGNTVFVYAVTGKPEELKKYAEAQEDKLRRENDDENGAPLWFTTRFAGQVADLIITADGKRVIADTSAMDQAASLATQYGGNLGQAIAEEAARKFMGSSRVSNVATATTPVETTEVKENLENM